MKPIAEIFSQGEEVVGGQIVDSNAAWLSRQLVELGFAVKRHTAVGDDLEDLKRLLCEIAERADCCICTGGLGPTVDDLTADAVAQAFSMPLRFDPVAYQQIERFFNARKRPMPETNRKQAMIPEGAERIDNAWGTAPGFALQYRRCRFVFLPGVPFEMHRLFDEPIRDWLKQRFTLQPGKLVTLKTIGVGESDLQMLLDKIKLPDIVQLGFRAGSEHVETKLQFPGGYPETAMTTLVDEVARLLQPFVFAIDGLNETSGGLVDIVDKLMTSANTTVSFVETASHGLMAAKCLGRSWLKGSVYEPSLASLTQRLNINIDTADLLNAGQVLAEAAWTRGTADIVLLQIYNGDPEQFHDKEQCIDLVTTLVHNSPSQSSWMEQKRNLSGPPERKQNQAALIGLNLLRQHLVNRK